MIAVTCVTRLGLRQWPPPRRPAIRARIEEKYGDSLAQTTRILYGGSVKAANAASILKERDVDGVLVGGASLDVSEFASIVRFEQHLVTD